MANLFNTVVGAGLSTLTVSNTITANFGAATSITVTNGTLLKNGIAVSSPAIVTDGDTLAIRVTSSSSYYTAENAVVRIGTQYHSFSVVSKQAPSSVPYAPFADIPPLQLTQYQDGTAYVPDSSQNVVTEFSTTGGQLTTIGLPASHSTVSSTNPIVVVTSYHEGTITWIDTVTNEVIAVENVGNRPHSVTYTASSTTDTRSLTWVTLNQLNQVNVYDYNRTLVATFPTGAGPTSIATSYNGQHVYVANATAGTVTHYTLTPSTGMWTTTTATVGPNPYGVAVDYTGAAWVTCSDNKLYRVSRTGVVTSYNTGNGPRGIALDSTGRFVWVACSKDNTVRKVYVSGASLGVNADTIAVDLKPMEISIGKDKHVLVSCFSSNTVVKVDYVDGNVRGRYAAAQYPYGVAGDTTAGTYWTANLYNNTPSYFVPVDLIPNAITFEPAIDELWNKVDSYVRAEGTVGSTTFRDTKGRSVAVVGSGVTVSNEAARFGASSIKLAGTGGLRITNAVIGTTDFAIEFYVYNSTGTVAPVFFDMRNTGTSGNGINIGYDDTLGQFYAAVGSGTIVSGGGPIELDRWYHIALAKSGGTIRMFVDGNKIGTDVIDANDYQDVDYWVGASAFNNASITASNVHGYMDDIRVTIGAGRYAANFVPNSQLADQLPAEGLEILQDYTTETVTVSGLAINQSVPVSVPAVYEATLVLDDNPGSGLISNNGTLHIKFKAPAEYDTEFEIPLIIGETTYFVTGETKSAIRRPDNVAFDLVQLTAPISEQTSSDATISGLAEGAFVMIKLSDPTWKIVLNGVVQQSLTVAVQNGDIIALQGIANAENADAVGISVSARVGIEDYVFGTFNMQVPTINNGIKWEWSSHISDEVAKYVKWEYSTRDTTGRTAMQVELSPKIAEIVAAFEHRTHINYPTLFGGLPTSIKAVSPHTEVSPEVAKYVESVKPHREVSAVGTYTGRPIVHRKTITAPIFSKNVSPELITAEPAYAKNTSWTLRNVAPVYVKNTSFTQRKVVPKYTKWDTPEPALTIPVCEKNTSWTLRTIEPVYTRNTVPVKVEAKAPVYVKFGTQLMPTIVPQYVATLKPVQHTIPGPTSEDYIFRPVYGRTLSTGANYVVVGSRDATLTGQMIAAKAPYAPVTVAGMEPLKHYYVHNVEFDDTPEQQGLYATAEEAAQAGVAAGYDDSLINTKLMPSGAWMWNVTLPLPEIECDGSMVPEPPGGIPMPAKWYVHGG